MKRDFRTLHFLIALTAISGLLQAFDKNAEWESWQKFAATYEGNYSDSSEYLAPPKEGRLAKPVRLCENGEALAEIVVDLTDAINIENYYPDETKRPLALRWQTGYEKECAKSAAFELRDLLKMITGADFKVVTKPTGEKKTRIFLGAPFAKSHFPDDIKALSSAATFDGFAVREKDGDIYIFGATPPGTLYGAIRFIENNTDLIIAAPGRAGMIYTKSPNLDAVWGDARIIPDFRVRGYQGGDREWKMRNGLNFFEKEGESQGFFALYGGHYLCPQYYDYATGLRKWNSMNNKGERAKTWDEYRDHACLSDPEFLKHAIETVPGTGSFMYSMPYVTVIGMDDNPSVCHCEKCKAPITAEDGTVLTPEKDKEDFWSAWFYTYLNKVDDEIQKRCPGYTTSTFAYFFAKTYPKIKVNKTIVPWLCTYWRGDFKVPVFAPKHEIWQRCYEGWAAHTGDLMLYDYYGLSIGGAPYAEVYQRELRYQKSLGFLATSTEGFMKGDDLGTMDDRWCMARLAWNSEEDVEELHRYFTRRAYREAAPYMHRIRGMIRKAYYPSKEDELKKVIEEAELAQPIMDELAKAQEAVKHPGAARLVKRAAAEWGRFLGVTRPKEGEIAFERIMAIKENKWDVKTNQDGDPCFIQDLSRDSGSTIALPKGIFNDRLVTAVLTAGPGYFETCGIPIPGVALNEKGKIDECEYTSKAAGENRIEITFRIPEGTTPAFFSLMPDRPRAGWTPPDKKVMIVDIKTTPDDGRLLGEVMKKTPPTPDNYRKWRKHYEPGKETAIDFDDPLQPLQKRREALLAKIKGEIRAGSFKTAESAIAFYREHAADAPAKAWGYSTLMNSYSGQTTIHAIAVAFEEQGLYDESALAFDAWIEWDGEKTPFDIRWRRMKAKYAFFTGKRPKGAEKVAAKVKAEYDAMLKRAVSESSRAAERTEARLALAERLPAGGEEYRKEILAILNDEFAPNTIRAQAAKLLAKAFTKGNGKCDWAGAESALHAALASGDWSNLSRSCYSSQSSRDLQLDSLLALVQAEKEAGETARAKAFLNKETKLLGYERTPAQTLKAETATIPRTHTKPTISNIKERYSELQRVKNSLEAEIAPDLDEADRIIDLE